MHRAIRVRAHKRALFLALADGNAILAPWGMHPLLSRATDAQRADVTLVDDGKVLRFAKMGADVPVDEMAWHEH